MNLLELINKITVRLRIGEVASLADPNSDLPAHFVNQAKEETEDIGPWFALRSEKTVTTVSGTESYAISGTNDRSYVHTEQGVAQVFVTTSNSVRERVPVVPYDVLRAMHELDTSQSTGLANYVAFTKGSSGLTARFYPIPDAVRTYKVVCVTPQAELTAETDVLTIPARPVWMLALAYTAQERGEELSGGNLEAQARIAVDNAVLTDFANGHESQTF